VNFQTMDYFIALAEERSFTRAAERLNVTQQTLSAHIAAVEKDLGVHLVVRRVPLDLTYAGEQFLTYARRFKAEHDTMLREFKDITDDERGLLRVGVTSTRGHIIMPHAIAAFQKVHPGIEIDLNEGENQELVSLLSDGRIDVMVGTVLLDIPRLIVQELYQEEVVLVVSKKLLEQRLGDKIEQQIEHVERTGDLSPLAQLPYLVLGRRDIPGTIAMRTFQKAGFTPKIAVRSKNAETLLALASRGSGACFSPMELVETTFSREKKREMRFVHLGTDARYPIHVAWRSAAHPWSMVGEFCSTLRETVGSGQRQSVRGDA
jgi:DNA-binding transcriptional LysR family regulator